jgi:hypothetical protein
MKLIVKKSHLKTIGTLILAVVLVIVARSFYLHARDEVREQPVPTETSLQVKVPVSQHRWLYSSDPSVEATAQAETDEMIRKGIEEEEQKWKSKRRNEAV